MATWKGAATYKPNRGLGKRPRLTSPMRITPRPLAQWVNATVVDIGRGECLDARQVDRPIGAGFYVIVTTGPRALCLRRCGHEATTLPPLTWGVLQDRHTAYAVTAAFRDVLRRMITVALPHGLVTFEAGRLSATDGHSTTASEPVDAAEGPAPVTGASFNGRWLMPILTAPDGTTLYVQPFVRGSGDGRTPTDRAVLHLDAPPYRYAQLSSEMA